MPFVAMRRSTSERIDIGSYRNPKAELPPDDLVCQFEDCAGALFIRAGLQLAPHFAHRPCAPCKTRYASHAESEAHRAGKRTVEGYLRAQFETQGIAARIEFEVPIKEAGRVADVLVTYPSGWREAHEIQLASITPQELAARTTSYFDAGVDAIWWLGLGSAADNAANRRWLEDYQAEYLLLAPAPASVVATQQAGGVRHG
jgi:competence CoiA-like predicted nuclease